MSDFAQIARKFARKISLKNSGDGAMNIIEFIESKQGLRFAPELSGTGLFPVQKFILKCYYNLPLESEEKVISIPRSWDKAGSLNEDDFYHFTEVEYLAWLYDQGRTNIKDLSTAANRRELVLVVGRRSGKSAISAMVAAYETYLLLRKHNPQAYYGMPDGAAIQICTVATAQDQAAMLYNEVKRHYSNCDFFTPYQSRDTQKGAGFQTPHDIERTGSIVNDGVKGLETLKVKFFSSNSSGLRGPANIVVIMDEFAFFPYTGVTSDREVFQAVTPSQATFSPKDPSNPKRPIGPVEYRRIMISSPYAKRGLFYETYMLAKAQDEGSKSTLMFQIPSWEVNPTIPKDFLEAEFAKNPENFRCEYGAEFSDTIKSWISDESILEPSLDYEHRPVTSGRPREPHYMGLDLAVAGDGTAAVLTRPVAIDENTTKIELVYHEEWRPNFAWDELNPHLIAPFVPYAKNLNDIDVLDFDKIAEWLEILTRKFYIPEGVYDQWSAHAFDQVLAKKRVENISSQKFTAQDSGMMYNAFKELLYSEKLILYDYPCILNSDATHKKHAPYIAELLTLEATAESKNKLIVQAPQIPGMHDDFSDALVRSVWLSLQAMSKGKFKYTALRGAGRNSRSEVGYSSRDSRLEEVRRARQGDLGTKRPSSQAQARMAKMASRYRSR